MEELSPAEPEVGHVCAAKHTIFEVDFNTMRDEVSEQNVQLVNVVIMLRGVEQEIIDVDDDVGNAGDDGLHEALE